MEIDTYRPEDEEAVTALWHLCGLVRPHNLPAMEIARKMAEQPDLLLVGRQGERVIATVMVGYDGHRGWINYLAVHPDEQRKGYGERMVKAAEALLQERGCPKINLQVRSNNLGVIAFYERLGYSVDDVVSLGKRLEWDDPAD